MIAVITGASQGIGFETARYLGRVSGMKVYALSRNRERLDQLVREHGAEIHGSKIIPVSFDLDQFLQYPGMIDELLNQISGHVDIVINNAGQLVNKPFEELGLKEWEQIYRINVFAPAMMVKSMLPFLGKKGPSHVVNISSMGGYQGSMKFAGLSAYSSSKAALACLTECLGLEYKDSDVVFNCLALGSVQTEMLAEAFPGYVADMSAARMAEYIGEFALKGHRYFRGKIIPVSSSTP